MTDSADKTGRRILRVRDLAIVVALFAGGMLAVAWFARDSVRRDRERLVERFGAERAELLQAAALQIEAEFRRLTDDLRLADRLVDTADSTRDGTRELRALATVVPAYRLVTVSDSSGATLLTAAAPELDERSLPRPISDAMAATIREAWLRPAGELAISGRIPGESIWLRVAALADPNGTGADRIVAFLVDTQSYFSKLDLLALEPGTRVLVMGPSGAPASLSDSGLADRVADIDQTARTCSAFAGLVGRVRSGERGRGSLPGDCARSIGIDDAEQAVSYSPVDAGPGARWTVTLFSSTGSLRSHETMLYRRAVTIGALAGILLLGIATYVAWTIRRAAILKEKLRAADRVAHANEKADKILDSIPTMVLAVSASRQVTACNRAFRERAGEVSPGSSLAVAFRDAPAAVVEELERLLRTASGSGTIQSLPGTSLPIFGQEGKYNLHAVPLQRRGPEEEALVVIEDLTELGALEGRLIRSEKLATVGVLAAGIAHEIGTPLGIVRGRAEYMLSRSCPEPLHVDGLHVIVDQADQVSRTVSQLLDFSRQRPARQRRVPLALILGAVIELLRYEAERRQVTMSSELPDDLPALLADADLLQQVLVILLMNACDASAPGGRIRVDAAADSDMVRIAVEDDGCGIPPEHQHRIFDPFFTTKKRGRGTGLGLSIAAQIVRDHGGRIQVDSQVGEGTCAVVWWPRAAEKVEADRIAG